MLYFPEEIKFTFHGEIAILYNLKEDQFIKIPKKGLEFLRKYLEEDGEELAGTLDEAERKKFTSFLSFLKEKKYIREGYPDAVKSEKEVKREFLETRRSAYYQVTDKCNLKCRFCYANPNFVPDKIEGDINLAKQIIRQAGELNIRHLVISGGEPLLRKDIYDVIRCAKKNMDKVTIITNGVLIDREEARKIKETGIDVVSISLESPYEHIHDNLRGKGTYKKILAAVDYLKQEGFNKDSLTIIATMTRKNMHVLHEYPEFAESLGVSMNLSAFQPVGRGKVNEELGLTHDQFLNLNVRLYEVDAQKAVNEIKKKEGKEVCIDDVKLVSSLRPGCGIVKESLGIKPNGDLVPCHLFFSINAPDMMIGNIFETSIGDKLWDFYNEKIPQIDEKEGCKDCNLRYLCGSSCLAAGYFKEGTLNTPHPFCGSYKNFYSAFIDALGRPKEFAAFRQNISRYLNYN